MDRPDLVNTDRQILVHSTCPYLFSAASQALISTVLALVGTCALIYSTPYHSRRIRSSVPFDRTALLDGGSAARTTCLVTLLAVPAPVPGEVSWPLEADLSKLRLGLEGQSDRVRQADKPVGRGYNATANGKLVLVLVLVHRLSLRHCSIRSPSHPAKPA